MSEWIYNDGGREAAGYKGSTGDCVVRAVAIASGLSYGEVYAQVNELAKEKECKGKRMRSSSSARTGVYTKKKWFKDYMASLGFEWVPTMSIGSGCKVHLDGNELPKGRLVANVSKHSVAVIDGVINDTYDCSREGTRCVYGYYILRRDPYVPNPPPVKKNSYTMTPKRRVEELAKKMGATVSGESYSVTVDAPDGCHWADSGVHGMVCDSWKDALERMNWGLEKCDKDTCCLWDDGAGRCENDERGKE